MSVPCRICGEETVTFGSHRIMGHYDGVFLRCGSCGFCQAENPTWLEEAYATPINAFDTGCVARTWELAAATAVVIDWLVRPKPPFLDYGGGYGLFVRHMRDLGYDFRWADRYCANLLAAGFEADLSDESRFGLVTAFEVAEHLTEPASDIEWMLRFGDNLLFSTTVMPAHLTSLSDWAYAGFEHGQHVSLFTLESLRRLAQRLDVRFATNGRTLHLFSPRPVASSVFRWATHPRISGVLRRLRRRQSLTVLDQNAMRGSFSRRGHDVEHLG